MVRGGGDHLGEEVDQASGNELAIEAIEKMACAEPSSRVRRAGGYVLQTSA